MKGIAVFTQILKAAEIGGGIYGRISEFFNPEDDFFGF